MLRKPTPALVRNEVRLMKKDETIRLPQLPMKQYMGHDVSKIDKLRKSHMLTCFYYFLIFYSQNSSSTNKSGLRKRRTEAS
jgi:hypothetical protein